ncbi:hypothetical protein H4582DRAFT_2055078 [Lactarius indigo]|nr:hypothetical protein H4582DRAFT_2055078 [Lactarius indigo]
MAQRWTTVQCGVLIQEVTSKLERDWARNYKLSNLPLGQSASIEVFSESWWGMSTTTRRGTQQRATAPRGASRNGRASERSDALRGLYGTGTGTTSLREDPMGYSGLPMLRSEELAQNDPNPSAVKVMASDASTQVPKTGIPRAAGPWKMNDDHLSVVIGLVVKNCVVRSSFRLRVDPTGSYRLLAPVLIPEIDLQGETPSVPP